jgi:hypothetical protein
MNTDSNEEEKYHDSRRPGLLPEHKKEWVHELLKKGKFVSCLHV